jgi:hypothetical protein
VSANLPRLDKQLCHKGENEMKRLTLFVVVLAVASVFVLGCQNESNLTNPGVMPGQLAMAIPTGATVTSATLHVYVNAASGQTVYAHRVTAPWDEMTVTWNSFGGAFMAAAVGSFAADGMGWRSVDVTALVAAWMDGTHPNHGVVLDHDYLHFPLTGMNSREAAMNQPYLEVNYMAASGPGTEIVPALGDTYIFEFTPDRNFGDRLDLWCGTTESPQFEKKALLQFELPEEPPEETGECEGKVTQLTLRYDGSIVDAHIVVQQKLRRDRLVVFDGIVQPGETFTFVGMDRHGTFGPETYYWVNGVYNTNIHTSCSQPIGPGLVSGDFTVIEGYSRGGGLLPPL